MNTLSFNIRDGKIPDIHTPSRHYKTFQKALDNCSLDDVKVYVDDKKNSSVSFKDSLKGSSTSSNQSNRRTHKSNFGDSESTERSLNSKKKIREVIGIILGRSNNPIINLKNLFEKMKNEDFSREEFIRVIFMFLRKYDNIDNTRSTSSTFDSSITKEQEKTIEESLILVFENIDYSNTETITFENFIDYVLTFSKHKEEELLKKYKFQKTLEFPGSEITKSMFYLPQTNTLVAVLKNREIRFLNPFTLESQNFSLPQSHPYEILSVETSPFANQLILSDSGMSVHFFEFSPNFDSHQNTSNPGSLKTSKHPKTILRKLYHKNFYHVGSMTKLVYSNFHNMLFSSTIGGNILVWTPFEKSIPSAASSKKNSNNSSSAATQKRIIEFDTSELKNSFHKHLKFISDMIVTEQGKLYSCSLDSSILDHTVKYGQLTSQPLRCNHKHGVFGIAYNEYHDFLISCGRESSAYIYLGRNTKPFPLFDERKPHMHAIQFVKTIYNEVFTLDSYGILKIYDVRTFRAVQTIQTEEISKFNNSFESQSNIVNSLIFISSHSQKHLEKKRKNEKLKEDDVIDEEKKILCSGSSIKIYKFQVSDFPQRACDGFIVDIFYQKRKHHLIIINPSKILIYDIYGAIISQIEDLSKKIRKTLQSSSTKNEEFQQLLDSKKDFEITCACLNPSGKIIHIGTHQGFIFSIDISTCSIIKQFKFKTGSNYPNQSYSQTPSIKKSDLEITNLNFVGQLVCTQWKGYLTVFDNDDSNSYIISEIYSCSNKRTFPKKIYSSKFLKESSKGTKKNEVKQNRSEEEVKHIGISKKYHCTDVIAMDFVITYEQENQQFAENTSEFVTPDFRKRIISGRKIVTGDRDGKIILWSLSSGLYVKNVYYGDLKTCKTLYFLGKSYFVCSDGSGFLYIYQSEFPFNLLRKWENINYYEIFLYAVTSVLFHDGKYLICGDMSGYITIYCFPWLHNRRKKSVSSRHKKEIKKKEVLMNFKAHCGEINKFMMIPLFGKNVLCSSCLDSEVFFWEFPDDLDEKKLKKFSSLRKIGELKQETSHLLDLEKELMNEKD